MSDLHHREIGFVDTTLRDGQQCLWATRMTTGMMLPVAAAMDTIGFRHIDLMGMIQFDVCVRYLNENPWDRIRLLRQQFERTPLQAGIRSKSLTGFGLVPQDSINVWVDCLIRSGCRRVLAFDGLLEVRNITETLLYAKSQGVDTIGALVFAESPLHTDEVYVAKARELVRDAKVDAVMLKDSGGLLTPDRIKTLVPAMKAAIGDVPLEIHSHGMTGLATLVYLEAVKAGADVVQTGISPLADGPAQPATQIIVPALRELGLECGIDLAVVEEVSTYLSRLASQTGRPVGRPLPYDTEHYKHQVPGGMMTNLKSQLAALGLERHLDAVLAETGVVREDLAWPIMVTPFAQLVVTQALLNVTQGERYRVVPDEMKMYALGHFGRHLGPLNQDALDRIVDNGSRHIAPQAVEPADVMPDLRKQWPGLSDEDRLLHYMFPKSMVDQIDNRSCEPFRLSDSLTANVRRVLELRPDRGQLRFEDPTMYLSVK